MDPEPTRLQRIVHALTTLRWWSLIPVPIGIIVLSSFGPDGLREPLERMLWLSWACVFAAMAHAARRLLFPTVDFSEAWQKATEGSIGAAIAALGVLLFTALIFLGLVSQAKAAEVDTRIPVNAGALLPQLADVERAYWPEHPFPSYFGALIEQESCVTLTSARCWSPAARLKTDREEGGGLGQFTRAINADDSIRFDALAEVRQLDPVGLRDFSWSTVYVRADLSMRAIMVKTRDCWRRLERQTAAAPPVLMAFCDAAYNGGMGGLLQDRRLCAARPGCDPNEWFGQVEQTSAKSRTKWQGYGKSAFEINREHVRMAVVVRRPKYMAALGADRL